MNAGSDEKLTDYAVDVRKLRHVHEDIVAKKSEIIALVAEEQNLGPVDKMSDSAKESLESQVDKLLEQWEKEKNEDGHTTTGSGAFNNLAKEHYELTQKVLDAQDNQVEEATEHPFEHPLR